MKTAAIELVENGDEATLYSIRFENEDLTEFGKFLDKFRNNAKLQKEFRTIVRVLEVILSKGVEERRFRYEGKIKD